MIMVTRRGALAAISACGFGALAGCAGNNDNADEDDTPETDTDTGSDTESYDPDDYYGLPKCDGGRSVQLIDVQGSDGIIQNVSTDDLLVYVSHDGDGNNGEWCGYYRVGAGEQTAYETYEGSPDEILIVADDDTSRNRDRICNQGDLRNGEEAGCVDPNTFRG